MPKIRAEVKISEKGPWANGGMAAVMNQLQGAAELKVGSFGKAAEEPHPEAAPLTTGELAAVHELGLGVPERSWLRSWVDSHRSEIDERMKTGVQRILKGESRKKIVEEIGFWMADSIRDNIDSGHIQPPISIAQALKKGHDTPLLDTAALVNSIIYAYKLPNIKSVRQTSPEMAEALRRGK